MRCGDYEVNFDIEPKYQLDLHRLVPAIILT